MSLPEVGIKCQHICQGQCYLEEAIIIIIINDTLEYIISSNTILHVRYTRLVSSIVDVQYPLLLVLTTGEVNANIIKCMLLININTIAMILLAPV